MQTIIKIAVVSVLSLFAIVGVVSISKASEAMACPITTQAQEKNGIIIFRNNTEFTPSRNSYSIIFNDMKKHDFFFQRYIDYENNCKFKNGTFYCGDGVLEFEVNFSRKRLMFRTHSPEDLFIARYPCVDWMEDELTVLNQKTQNMAYVPLEDIIEHRKWRLSSALYKTKFFISVDARCEVALEYCANKSALNNDISNEMKKNDICLSDTPKLLSKSKLFNKNVKKGFSSINMDEEFSEINHLYLYSLYQGMYDQFLNPIHQDDDRLKENWLNTDVKSCLGLTM